MDAQLRQPALALGSELGIGSKQDQAEHAYQVVLEAWKVQEKKAQLKNTAALRNCNTDENRDKLKPNDPSIAAALVNAYGTCELIMSIVYSIVAALLGFVPVLILNDLV
jgi:hypothetical protein